MRRHEACQSLRDPKTIAIGFGMIAIARKVLAGDLEVIARAKISLPALAGSSRTRKSRPPSAPAGPARSRAGVCHQKVRHRRFGGTRCDPGLSRFDKSRTLTRQRRPRFCRGRPRIHCGCAAAAAGGRRVTQDARERFRGSRARPNGAACVPETDGIASGEHAIAVGDEAIVLLEQANASREHAMPPSLLLRAGWYAPPPAAPFTQSPRNGQFSNH
jgi:hypothetical protein